MVALSKFPYSPDGRVGVPEVDDPPHVGAEPHGGPGVRLVLSDKYGVRDWQESHQSSVLKEPVAEYSHYTVLRL